MTTVAPDLKTLAVAGQGTRFSIQDGAATVTSFTSVVSTSSTGVTWVSGSVFSAVLVGQTVTINGVNYTVASYTDNHDIVLETSAGTQTSVSFAASVTIVTYEPVAELKTLDFSGSKNDIEDVSNFDSASRFKEYIVTMADAGDCSISGNYIAGDTGQGLFRGAFTAGTVLSFQIVLPLQSGQTSFGEKWVFNGIVQELDNAISYDKALTFSAKLKVTGPIVVTPGA